MKTLFEQIERARRKQRYKLRKEGVKPKRKKGERKQLEYYIEYQKRYREENKEVGNLVILASFSKGEWHGTFQSRYKICILEDTLHT